MKIKSRTSLVDLGWAVARLEERWGSIEPDDENALNTWQPSNPAWHPYMLTLFSPAEEGNAAQSVAVVGPANINSLAKLLLAPREG